MIQRTFGAAVLSIFLPLISHAGVQIASELKDWPWYESTLLAGVSAPTQDLGAPIFISRADGAPAMELRSWKATKRRHPLGLFLIIPGTGGNSRSGTANLLAELATQRGFDAVVLVNPFSPEFQSRWSTDGMVGFPQHDIHDTQLMVRAAYLQYVQQNGVPKETRMLGFSLGATYTALLYQRQLGFPVKEFLLLNPPVNFAYAMNELDQMMMAARNDDDFGLFKLLQETIPFFRAAADGLTLSLLPELRNFTKRSEFENRQVIGASFGITLFQVTNGLKSRKPFDTQAQRVRMNGRLLTMSFARYTGLIGVAIGQTPELRGRTFAQLEDDVHLAKILASGKNLQKLVVITNEDDFLIRRDDLRWLNQSGVKQVYTFDGGGHCGNYWTPSFKKLFRSLE